MNNEHSSYPDFPEDKIVEELQQRIKDLEKENKQLQRDSDLLNCLESWGVDNWQGYDDAKAEWRQLHNE